MLVAQSYPTLWDSMEKSSPSCSSVHGILQARILEWVAIPFFKGSSQARNRTWVSHITGIFFTIWTTRAVLVYEMWVDIVPFFWAEAVKSTHMRLQSIYFFVEVITEKASCWDAGATRWKQPGPPIFTVEDNCPRWSPDPWRKRTVLNHEDVGIFVVAYPRLAWLTAVSYSPTVGQVLW